METYRVCPKCNGTGESAEEGPAPPGEDPVQVPGCSMCNSTGRIKTGVADDSMILNDLDKCKKWLKKIMDKLGISY